MACRFLLRSILALSAVALAGCTQLPRSGPMLAEVVAPPKLEAHGIQIVELEEPLARRLSAQRGVESFAEILGTTAAREPRIGPGDALEISLWEAPPATLFSGAADPRASASGRATMLPEQLVGAGGTVRVPFAGMVPAVGLSTGEVEDEIVRRLAKKANQPQALVRIVRNTSSMVTVIGEVTTGLRVPLTAGGERLLDALAAAGGVRQPVNKMTIKVSRGTLSPSMALESVIRDPRQNIPLQAGDVITAVHRPHAFVALGATGKNEEVEFEATGVSLAQALARSGGLLDQRADARGVFVFRFEQATALGASGTAAGGVDGRVPVVYRLNLQDPASLFVAQAFEMRPRDVLYVTNAPAAELQKFLNLLLPLVSPTIAVTNVPR